MNSAKILAQQRATRWAGIIRECRESGLSVAAFCKQAGVNTSRYYYWLKKLRDEACELFVLSRISEESAAVRPQGFAQVEILDDLADVSSAGAGSADVCTTVSLSGSTQAIAPTLPIPFSDDVTESAIKPLREGQINIEATGIKISADSTYPVAALAELLRGLANDGAYGQRGGTR